MAKIRQHTLDDLHYKIPSNRSTFSLGGCLLATFFHYSLILVVFFFHLRNTDYFPVSGGERQSRTALLSYFLITRLDTHLSKYVYTKVHPHQVSYLISSSSYCTLTSPQSSDRDLISFTFSTFHRRK